jgi:hypothetical protein
MSASSTPPSTPSAPSPERLQELTAANPHDDRVDDILKLSLVPDEAHDTFCEMVGSIDEFLASDESAITLLVDELANAHKPLAKSAYKRRILLNNLLSLADYK